MDAAQRAGQPVARVMTWNILAGGWPRLDAIEAVLRSAQPDIVGLQEIEPRALDRLAARLGMLRVFGVARRDDGLPVGLLSRWPVIAVPTQPGAPRRIALLEAQVEPPGVEPLRVFVTHLSGSYSGWRAGEGVRLAEIGDILARIARLDAPDRARLLLMGDFNSLAPGEGLLATRLLRRAAANDSARAQGEELAGLPGLEHVLPPPLRPLGDALVALARWAPAAQLLDSATGLYFPRAVITAARDAGLVDLAAAAQPDPRQRAMTCPSDEPAGRIDYLFASPALAKSLGDCETLADAPARPISAASDHRPVIATLRLA
jgi:endonuclease/exonuclease/phosphatase family metal-dependent hydrolase